ncbi:hypothetical protein [Aquibium microcysteis]|uniref:AbiU2 domain-containing protein n=1 Tax=Aquibium microcysteis TaxID=675281 RepID=UPI00165D2791|nr:hypothetical protein [Aquibium microcysteis]
MASSQKQCVNNLQDRILLWRQAFQDCEMGINNSVSEMLWDFAAFRSIVSAIRFSNQYREKSPPINGMLFEMISNGYWYKLLMGIRRLLDRAPLHGPKGVYSLRSVVGDIQSCRDRLTRQVYVERVWGARGTIDDLREDHERKLRSVSGAPIWGNPEIRKHECSQRFFDELSSVSEDRRASNDYIDENVFLRLERRLSRMDEIAEHVNSHIAHAGSAKSREGKTLQNFNLDHARDAIKELKQVADFIGIYFACEHSGDLPVFQGDQFEGLDRALVSASDIEKLRDEWVQIGRDIASWSLTAREL